MDIKYYFTYDLPVPYRNINIYPARVKDYLLFNVYSECLTFDKNIIPDSKIISMTELEYMYYCAQNENDEKMSYLVMFDKLLSICLREDKTFENIQESVKRYKYDNENKKPFFVIGEEKYLSKDFEEIKKIIIIQNLIELPDITISKEVRDSLEKAREYKRKISKENPASLEDYIISLSTVTGWTMEYIYSMSIRKFTKSIKRLDNLIHYKIYLGAAMSGMVEFKDKSFIKHWLTNIDEEDIYKDVTVDLDTVKNTISLESAKK
jgi:hypothetical protein